MSYINADQNAPIIILGNGELPNGFEAAERLQGAVHAGERALGRVVKMNQLHDECEPDPTTTPETTPTPTPETTPTPTPTPTPETTPTPTPTPETTTPTTTTTTPETLIHPSMKTTPTLPNQPTFPSTH